MDNLPQKGTGAIQSPYDVRTITHTATAAPLVNGGYTYNPTDIEDQHTVGICTAISLVQNAEKYFGKKFSPDFQYLMQKRMYDVSNPIGWDEGSSIIVALKVGKNVGFLPIENFPYITEEDRKLPYSQYIAKLQAIEDSTIQALIAQCEHKLTGYAQVDISSRESVAQAILDSKTGILCMYQAGSSWYTSPEGQISWQPRDIDPLRVPKDGLSGHAIINAYFDFTNGSIFTLANTWSPAWDVQGCAHIDYSGYPMLEAWIPYYDFTPTIPPFTHNFQTDMKVGDMNSEVTALQQALSTLGYFKVQPTGYYGPVTKVAVFAFQVDKVQLSFWERYIIKGGVCGPKTRAALNLIFNK